MTKQEAIKKVEEQNAKALYVRMQNGIPAVTVGWKDYMKVRELISEEMTIIIR